MMQCIVENWKASGVTSVGDKFHMQADVNVIRKSLNNH